MSHCPEVLPPSIIAPLLTPQCIRLMSEEASTEEDELWQSLGDAWNIPRCNKTSLILWLLLNKKKLRKCSVKCQQGNQTCTLTVISTQWPEDDEDIPTYTPQFFDGWQPPEVTAEPPPTPPLTRQRSAPKSVARPKSPQPGPSKPVTRQEDRQPAPSQVNEAFKYLLVT